MKKAKAYILRFFHCLKHILNLDANHRELTIGKSYRLLGFEIWFSAETISCTCGRIWYKKVKKT